eukprot:5693649-Pleurochrysis_carterae.AAC.1
MVVIILAYRCFSMLILLIDPGLRMLFDIVLTLPSAVATAQVLQLQQQLLPHAWAVTLRPRCDGDRGPEAQEAPPRAPGFVSSIVLQTLPRPAVPFPYLLLD